MPQPPLSELLPLKKCKIWPPGPLFLRASGGASRGGWLADDADRPGQRASVEAWVLSTLPRAVAFAVSLLRDRSAADDVVQDCYCRLLAKAAVYDLPRDGTRILFKAISNACVDRARALRELPLDAPPDDPDAPAAPEPVDRKLPEPSDVAARRELESALTAALARLPDDQRAAVELKALGYSLTEIAEAVGVTPNHAGVLVHRGRRALADHLTSFLDAPP